MSAQSPRAAPWPSSAAEEGRVALSSPRTAKAKSVIATVEHKRRDHAAAEKKVTMDGAADVFRHALRTHAANMADHVNMVAGVGPTQRQLPRKTSARVQYEDVTAAVAIHEYELDEEAEEGQDDSGDEGSFTRPHVPALRLPGADTAPTEAAAAAHLQQHTTSTWASARESAAPPSPRRHLPAASASPTPAPAAAAPAAVGGAAAAGGGSTNADCCCGDTAADAGGSSQPHVPRTEQLLLALKKCSGNRSGPGAAHAAPTRSATTPTALPSVQSPQPQAPPPRQAVAAVGDGNQDACAAPAASTSTAGTSNVAAPLSPRPMTSPSGGVYSPAGGGGGGGGKRWSQPGATAPPPGYPSIPPSAAATNVVSRSLTPRQMQQALAAMTNTGSHGGAAAAAAAAAVTLAPARSAASFTAAAAGGCQRPTLTQLFPEGAEGAVSGLGEPAGVERDMTAKGDDGGGITAQRSASHSFSGPALRRPPQRRGSMVLLPSGGVAGMPSSSSQALRPTLARANLARLARRSDTSSELHSYNPETAYPASVGGSGPTSPVSPVKAAGGASGGGGAHRGLRAAAEALFSKITRSPARGAAAGAQDWCFGPDDTGSSGQPPRSPSALRYASGTVGAAAGAAAGAASPFATAAASTSAYVGRSVSSGPTSPIAQPGTSSSGNLFAGMATAYTAAAVGAGGAQGSGEGAAGGTAAGGATSLRARVAPPSPLQVAVAQQSGEACWFVERTASAVLAGGGASSAYSASSSGRRLLPTPSALSATPAAAGGGGSYTSSSAAASPSGSRGMPCLFPSLLQPPAVAASATSATFLSVTPLAAGAPPSPGGVVPLAAIAPAPAGTATAAATASAGPAATAAESSDADCVSAPLQVLQPTPPSPTALRRGRVRASASCYAAAAPGVATAESYSAFAQKPRPLDTGNDTSPAHVQPPQPPPTLPEAPHAASVRGQPTPPAAAQPLLAEYSSVATAAASCAGHAQSGTATAMASVPLDVSPPQPPRPLLPDAQQHADAAFAFQQHPGASAGEARTAGDVARRAHESSQQARAHVMLASTTPGDHSSSPTAGSGGLLSLSGPAAIAAPAAAPAAAAAWPAPMTVAVAAAVTASATAAAPAAATPDEDANPSLLLSSSTSCTEALQLESLSCWAGALCDAAFASDRVCGPPPAVRSVHSFERTAWVARSREESLGRAPGPTAAAVLLLPATGRANAAEAVMVLGGEGEGEAAAGDVAAGQAPAAGVDDVTAACTAGGGATAISAAATAGNIRSGIMSRMKRALLPGSDSSSNCSD
ncbi:hypothetical protein HXX76_001818 [Chlamydomonas incerta]|uniref:Uncharacterized protein n=1 Tax=Chlamydomonas incerta TaxID=51695 RepID=A0A835TG26_CHLIN|nr:hypothetical protein HXX76_001818 [Chlamydomonas incerta]|eukprot:KAG2443461.1 hypothetical protein HXX76_001818 [Chlamydomonas incerta]